MHTVSVSDMGCEMSLQCLCLTWDVRLAHLGALLFLLGPAGTIGRQRELISRPCEAQALQRQWSAHLTSQGPKVALKNPCGLWERKVQANVIHEKNVDSGYQNRYN